MRRTTPILLALVASAVVPGAGCRPSAEPDDGVAGEAASPIEWRSASSADGTYFVRWRPLEEPIPLADPFDVEVEVWEDDSMAVPARFDRILVDAGMPHHRHGMNVAPEVGRDGPARWIARGMLFHMPGRWQLYVDLIEDGRLERSQWSMWLSG